MKHFILAMLLALSACHEKMAVDGKVRPDERLRPVPEGVVAREDSLSPLPPPPRTRELILRGQARYQIYCLPCHGFGGDGDGMIVRRGFSPPPTYHSDRLRAESDTHFFTVITNGYGAMYSYADRLDEQDRWAVIAYIRALQRSRNAKIDDVPADARARLLAQPDGASP